MQFLNRTVFLCIFYIYISSSLASKIKSDFQGINPNAKQNVIEYPESFFNEPKNLNDYITIINSIEKNTADVSEKLKNKNNMFSIVDIKSNEYLISDKSKIEKENIFVKDDYEGIELYVDSNEKCNLLNDQILQRNVNSDSCDKSEDSEEDNNSEKDCKFEEDDNNFEIRKNYQRKRIFFMRKYGA